VEEEALMFFFLSKTIGDLFLPSNLLIAAGLAGLALMLTRWRRAGKHLAITSLVLLLVLALLPVGALLFNVLDNRFPPWDSSRGPPDGIVVLGGAVDPDISLDRDFSITRDGAGRIIAIGQLARQFPSARIIYSGGNGSLAPGRPAEADFIYPLLDAFGVPRERVVLENRSRNTAENAAFTKVLADPKPGERWLLVTSAWHMPRAVGCFRRVGFAVEAYPVDWITPHHVAFEVSLQPVANLSRADKAVHEWIGLLAYWLSGRTSELLPGPQ
jgi:uncharacterized SAM-binding protein YcdF (DUF218 family)